VFQHLFNSWFIDYFHLALYCTGKQFHLLPFIDNFSSSIVMLDLTRPCDACGKMIGGGFKRCPKCQIYFCLACWIELMYSQGKLPLECPMCGGKLEYP